MPRTPVLTVSLSLLLMFSVLGIPNIAVAANLQVQPAAPRYGGEVLVGVTGLVPNAAYELFFGLPVAAPDDVLLGEFTASAEGTLQIRVSLPPGFEGGQRLIRLMEKANLIAWQLLDMPAPLLLAVDPVRPHAGDLVDLLILNAEPGELLVLYAGQPLFGPSEVEGGDLRLPVRLPRMFPAPLPSQGTTVEMRALQRRGNAVLASTVRQQFVEAARTTPVAEILNLQMPIGDIDPTERFEIRGQLQVREGRPEEYRLNAWFIPDEAGRGLSQRIFPLGSGAIQPQADGSFVLGAAAPTIIEQMPGFKGGLGRVLLRGERWATDESGQALDPRYDLGSAPSFEWDLGLIEFGGGPFNSEVSLNVEVVDQNGEPLRGVFVALVDLLAAPPENLSISRDSVGTAFRAGLINQFSNNPDMQLWGETPLNGQAFAGCEAKMFSGYTDDNGRYRFELSDGDLQYLVLRQFVRDCGTIVDGGVICEGQGGVSETRRSSITLRVNGSHLDYSPLPTSPVCGNLERDFELDLEKNALVNELGQSVSQVRVVLYERPRLGCQQLDFVPRLSRGAAAGAGGGSLPLLGWQRLPNSLSRIYTFDSLPSAPDAQAIPDHLIGPNRQTGWLVQVPYDPFQTGESVASATLRFDTTGNGQYDFQTAMNVRDNVAADCFPGGHVTAQLPDLTRQAAGRRRGEVNVTDTGGRNYRAVFDLQFQPLPSWFDIRNPQIQPNPTGIVTAVSVRPVAAGGNLRAIRRAQGAALTTGDLGYDIGSLSNTTDNDMEVVYEQTFGGQSSTTTTVISRNRIANNNSPPRSKSQNQGNAVIPINETFELFNTGRVPLFRFPWGIPPIASATLGADFWASSNLRMTGNINVSGLEPRLNLTTGPSLDLGLELFFNLSAVLGLVSAEAKATADSELLLLARTENNAFRGVDACFGFALNAGFTICAIGICSNFTENLICSDSPNRCHPCTNAFDGPPEQWDADLQQRCLTRPLGCKIGRSARGDLLTSGPERQTLEDLRSILPAALASNNQGRVISVEALREGGLRVRPFVLGSPDPVQLIDTDGFVSSIQVVYPSANRAMAVWSEIPANTQADDVIEAARAMHLRYAEWNGETWTTPSNLTLPGESEGDGNVSLTWFNCLPLEPCLSRGLNIAAVWIRDRVGDIGERRYSVMYSTWRPASGWTAPQPVDDRTKLEPTQMQPVAVYVNGQLLVMWVENDAEVPESINSRRLHYRVIGSAAGVQMASELPPGISWPSATVDSQGRVVLAYTVASDPEGFVGNRNDVFIARATCDKGFCSFDQREIRDQRGRRLRGESPIVNLSPDGEVQLTFRGLGYAPNAQGQVLFPDDPLGMLTGTGAPMQLRTRFEAGPGSPLNTLPISLGSDSINFARPLAVFDSAMDSLVITGVNRIPDVGALNRAREMYPRSGAGKLLGRILEDEQVLFALADTHDLALDFETPPEAILAPGSSVEVRLLLSNRGGAYLADEPKPSRILLSWDAEPGVAPAVAAISLPPVPANAVIPLQVQVPVPANARPDQMRRLHVALEGTAAVADLDPEDNRLSIAIGGLPVPQNLRAITAEDGQVVHLAWDDPEDQRVVAWRVYALDADGEPVSVAVTPVAGFADLTLSRRGVRRYLVTSVSADGRESAFSDLATAGLPAGDFAFRDRFERLGASN